MPTSHATNRLPFDPHSGWCDVQGRRSRIEDYHSIVFQVINHLISSDVVLSSFYFILPHRIVPLTTLLSLQEDYKFYGVFDGHCGTRAAKYASRALHLNLEFFLGGQAPAGAFGTSDGDTVDRAGGHVSPRESSAVSGLSRSHAHSMSQPQCRNSGTTTTGGGHPSESYDRQPLPEAESGRRRRETNSRHVAVERAIRAAFRKTQEDFLEQAHGGRHASDGGGVSSGASSGHESGHIGGNSRHFEEENRASGVGAEGGSRREGSCTAAEDSGTTATVALVYPHVTVVAHVGDSRAVLCCDEAGRAVEITEGEV